MGTMPKPLVKDELWAVIEPLLPKEPSKPKGGHPRVDDRAALRGIMFVLKPGVPWKMLPKEMGCGSGMACWRRLKEWHEAGVWKRLHRVLLDRLGEADRIDWSRASLDSATVPAPGGRKDRAESDRLRQTGFQAPSRGRRGKRPARSKAHRGQCPLLYDVRGDGVHHSADPATPRPTEEAFSEATRQQSIRCQEVPKDAPQARDQGQDSQERQGKQREAGRYRWVVERTLWWLNRFRRLKVRYE